MLSMWARTGASGDEGHQYKVGTLHKRANLRPLVPQHGTSEAL